MNTMATGDMIARDVWGRFWTDAAISYRNQPDQSLSVTVCFSGGCETISITPEQRQWSLDDIHEKLVRPRLIGLLEGAT